MKIPISKNKYDVFEKSIFYYWLHFLDYTTFQKRISPKLLGYLLTKNNLGLMFYFRKQEEKNLLFKPFKPCDKLRALCVVNRFLNEPKHYQKSVIKEVKGL